MGRTVNQFDQQRRLKLHSRGLTDSQLAAEVGITPGAASVWRKKEGLKRNNLRSEYETTEKERSIMSSFMSDLITISNRAKTKIDEDAIVRFILAWRLL
jgi:predicted transcriptional regulator